MGDDVQTIGKRFGGLVLAIFATLMLAACGGLMSKTNPHRGDQAMQSSTTSRLKQIDATPGSGMFIRVFKKSSEFEVWKQSRQGDYRLFNTYKICAWSGTLGPKVKEGDRQAPEGIYTITPGLMNPNSNYYLSFNTGFPNKFDRAWGRTGNNLMVHGDCSSAGCYSMTDKSVAEIYMLARESFKGGNTSIQMQIFPFRMTPQNIAAYHDNANMPFWRDIKEGYDRFELTRRPPVVDVCEKKYVFDLGAPQPLDAVAACPARKDDSLLAALEAKERADDAQVKLLVASLPAGSPAAAPVTATITAGGDALSDGVAPESIAPVPLPAPVGTTAG